MKNPNQDRGFLRGDLPSKEDVTIRVYDLSGSSVFTAQKGMKPENAISFSGFRQFKLINR
ncbi:MAG: hypothetical protein ACPG49_07675 [Chitinophagales bacterium]